MKNKNQLYAGIVWIASAISLAIYGIILFFNSQIPGIGDLVKYLSEIDDKYIYLAAFISIFIEGLYFVGSFFPGASLVLLIAIVSKSSGYLVFTLTLILIFIGWSLAGIINIYFAKVYKNKKNLVDVENYKINNRIWTTWFPAFRSSYEVAQIVEGGNPVRVFKSSIYVRFWATIFVGVLALIIPLLLNINNSFDSESLITIFVIFLISIIIGINKIKKTLKA